MKISDEKLMSLIGNTFRLLTVESYYGRWQGKDHAYNCLCECGNRCVTTRSNLIGGNSKSCGCRKHPIKKEKKEKTTRWTGMDILGMIGKKFNKLTVVSYYGKWKDGSHAYNCKCDCGKNTVAGESHLEKGRKKSCGCLKKENAPIIAINRTHGLSGTPEYTCWVSIKARCYNSNSTRYAYYGERGIKMSAEWFNSFEQFLSDMGEKPTPKHSIERDDVNGDYSKGNCRWVTAMEQSYNKRDTIWIPYDGRMWNTDEFQKAFGIDRKHYFYHMKRKGADGAVDFFIKSGKLPAVNI